MLPLEMSLSSSSTNSKRSCTVFSRHTQMNKTATKLQFTITMLHSSRHWQDQYHHYSRTDHIEHQMQKQWSWLVVSAKQNISPMVLFLLPDGTSDIFGSLTGPQGSSRPKSETQCSGRTSIAVQNFSKSIKQFCRRQTDSKLNITGKTLNMYRVHNSWRNLLYQLDQKSLNAYKKNCRDDRENGRTRDATWC